MGTALMPEEITGVAMCITFAIILVYFVIRQ